MKRGQRAKLLARDCKWLRSILLLAGLGVGGGIAQEGLLRPAVAHAILARAIPFEGEVMSHASFPIELTFNIRIHPTYSKFSLLDEGGKEVPLTMRAEAGEAVFKGQTEELSSGVYRLKWQVLAQDGHISNGEIRFQVIVLEPASNAQSGAGDP